MILKDYHMHTTYCDGTASAEEMVQEAVRRGLTEIGFSGHSHTAFDESYCMSEEQTERYRQELLELRKRYADRISIKIGLEMDRYSDADPSQFDYCIGSVHYIRVPAEKGKEDAPAGCLPYEGFIYIPIDETPQILRAAADAYFDGDLIALAVHFFDTAAEVCASTGCSIIGHFDLITKFNEGGRFFDESDPRYIAAWQRAADQLLQEGVPFEINTGAISKGYRTEAYPAKNIRDYIRQQGGRFILSSDSHRTDTLCYGFEEYEAEV